MFTSCSDEEYCWNIYSYTGDMYDVIVATEQEIKEMQEGEYHDFFFEKTDDCD